jgi:hypothetical protein
MPTSTSSRLSLQDFLSAIRQQSNGVSTYGATLAADGSVVVTKTPVAGGPAVTLYPKVWWNISPSRGSSTSGSANTDTVTICYSDGSNANTGDATTFLNSLT